MNNHFPLQETIAAHINELGGFLPFDQYMELALYHEEAGYYQNKRIFGADGDFITGPDLGLWLALGFAELIHEGWKQLGSPDEWAILEQGGGSGRLLTQIVQVLDASFGLQPRQLIAVEQSPFWRQQQQAHYNNANIVVDQFSSLDDVSLNTPVLIFSNELPDAFPIRCFSWQQQQYYERGVGMDDEGSFCWRIADKPMSPQPDINTQITEQWPQDYNSELNHRLMPWQQQIMTMINTQPALVFTLDYGYNQQEYYRANRKDGTLMGHAEHQVIIDVLTVPPGSSDLTAHVDFTALASSGQSIGFQTLAYMTQGGWLASTPLVQSLLSDLAANTDMRAVQQIAHAKRLMLPHAGMGETFKLLIQGRGINEPPEYLKSMNRLKGLNLD